MAVHDAMSLLRGGFTIEVNIHRRERREYPDPGASHFPTVALEAVEQERRELFTRAGEHYETFNTFLIDLHAAKGERAALGAADGAERRQQPGLCPRPAGLPAGR